LRFGDGLKCSGQFGRDGHHANCALRRVPILPEELLARLDEVVRWMYAALGVADKRTLQMNAEWTRSPRACILRDCPAQMLQSAQDAFFWRSHGSGQVTRDPMLCHSTFYSCKCCIICFHHIVTGAPMDMDVDEARRQDQIRIVEVEGIKWKFAFNAGGDGGDLAVFDQNDREIDSFQRRE